MNFNSGISFCYMILKNMYNLCRILLLKPVKFKVTYSTFQNILNLMGNYFDWRYIWNTIIFCEVKPLE